MSQETNSAPVTENKMGTMPIGRLVLLRLERRLALHPGL